MQGGQHIKFLSALLAVPGIYPFLMEVIGMPSSFFQMNSGLPDGTANLTVYYKKNSLQIIVDHIMCFISTMPPKF